MTFVLETLAVCSLLLSHKCLLPSNYTFISVPHSFGELCSTFPHLIGVAHLVACMHKGVPHTHACICNQLSLSVHTKHLVARSVSQSHAHPATTALLTLNSIFSLYLVPSLITMGLLLNLDRSPTHVMDRRWRLAILVHCSSIGQDN